MKHRLVCFDLDGTLVDSFADMRTVLLLIAEFAEIVTLIS